MVAGAGFEPTTFGFLGTMDDIQAEQNEYCAMVQLYLDTEGEYGWPDYTGNFENKCKLTPK